MGVAFVVETLAVEARRCGAWMRRGRAVNAIQLGVTGLLARDVNYRKDEAAEHECGRLGGVRS